MSTLEKKGNRFILTLTGDNPHWLSPTLITSLLSALREAKSQATRGSVLITTSHGKFFSNGFDLSWAQAEGKSNFRKRLGHMVEMFRPVVAELISLPMPTIAAVNGHAAAAGFLLALSHDYILMRSDRGVFYMSEVDLGLTLPDYFSVMFRAKIGSVSARRNVLLKGEKVRAVEAVKMGFVDSVHDSEGSLTEYTMRFVEELSKRNWNGDVYKEIRKSLYPEACGLLGLSIEEVVSKL